MVSVGADVRPFTAKMGEVDAQLKETGAGAGKFGGLIAGAGLLAAGAVTGIAAFGIAAIAKTEEAGQAAFEMSEKFGLLPGVASAYMAVGAQLGLTNEQIGKGFQFLSKNAFAMQMTLDAHGKVSAATGQVYKDLGINVLDSGGKVKSANELMLEAADAFKAMADGPEKAALAMKLFGKSGTDLLPMLNQGSAGIRKMMADGQAMGDVMSGPQVEAAHKLFLEHKQLDTAIAGITTRMGTALMPVAISIIPVFLGFVDALSHTHEIIGRLQPWFPLIAGGLTVVGGVMAAILIPMFIAWTVATWAQVAALTAQAIAMVAAYWPILLIIAAIAAVVTVVVLLVQHWDLVKAKSIAVWSAIKDHVAGIVEWFKELPGKFLTMAEGIGSGILKGITGALSGLGGALSSLFVAGLKGMVSLLPSILQGPILGAFKDLGVPGFAMGGLIPGPYLGAPVLIQGHAGETVSRIGQSAAARSGASHVTEVHVHMDGIYAGDGPSLDILANKIALRLGYATGR